MKSHFIWIVGLSLITACAVQEPESETNATTSDSKARPSSKTLQHMHEHAEKLGELNLALDNGDLERASIPAFWLSKHEKLDRLPRRWQKYIDGVQKAAHEVEFATDLESARAASLRITEQCQACHAAAEVSVEL